MYLRDILPVTHPVEVIEDHVTLAVCISIAELRQLTPIQHQCIFGRANNAHIRFQHLRTAALGKVEKLIMLESLFCSLLYHFRDLLKSTEYDHTRGIIFSGHGFLFQQSVTESEILSNVKAVIRMEGLHSRDVGTVCLVCLALSLSPFFE